MNYRKGKIKIAVLGVKGLPFTGGLEIIMEEIGSRFIQDGYQFDVFVRKNFMKKNISNYKGIQLKYSPGINSKHLDAITHTFTAILQIIFYDYDIVFINAIGLSLLAWIPKLFGKKVITQVHGLDYNREKWQGFAKLALRFSLNTTVWLSDKIICVSLEDKKIIDNKFKVDCVYIPNGVNERYFVAPDIMIREYQIEPNNYFLFMARLVKEKGCHTLINAFKKLDTEKILIIAGDNNHKEKYTEDLKRNASDKIRFLGFVDGRLKEELLSNSFCYILPSTLEAMPISLLEAMNYGNCIVASALQEIRNIIGEQETLFEPGNEEELINKLNFVLRNRGYVEQQKKDMMKIIKMNHRWPKIYPQYKEVVDCLANN